jgi:PKD repeat protein
MAITPDGSKRIALLAIFIAMIVVTAAVASVLILSSDTSPNEPPTASFTAPSSGQVGQNIIFDASSSNDSDGRVVNYSWDFGDCNSSVIHTKTVSHSYERQGIYPITLTVTDDDGESSAPANHSITITEAEEPFLSAGSSPDSISVAKGEQIRIEAYAVFKSNASDTGENVSTSISLSITIHWMAGGSVLGTLFRGRTAEGVSYFMLKTTVAGTSALHMTFMYTDNVTGTAYTDNVTIPVAVTPAVLDSVEINPSEWMALKNHSRNFSATARLTDWTEVNAEFEWNLTDVLLGTLNATNGPSVRFTAGSQLVSGDLTCSAHYLSRYVFTSAHIVVFTGPPPQSIETRIYGMFNVPLGDWWLDRYQETIIHNSFPYTYAWHTTPAGNDWIYSDYRMNVTAHNISKVNTSENPWYVPVLNPTVRGGNIQLDWEGNYLSHYQAINGYQTGISDWYDSWFWRWNGTVTMDKTAAKMVMNMTDVDFNDFTTWKADKFPIFKQKFSNWIQTQMNVDWAIKFAYQFEGNTLFESYDVEKVGNNIVFKILDHLSWGMETLLERWWSQTFTQFEGWPEDAHFTASIGPLWSDMSLDCAVQYSLTSMGSMRDGRTAWVFEATRADAVPGSFGAYASEFNPYNGKSYWCEAVSNYHYKAWTDYSYTPLAWKLNEYDEIRIEWPSSNQIIGYNDNGPGNYGDTVTGKVDPLWIEPVPDDVPGHVSIDYLNRTIVIKGPLDTQSWSMNTLAVQELKENWSRLGVLPWGCPRIEFVVNNDLNLPPTAVISAPDTVATSVSTSISSVSFDLDGAISSYLWDFGDGNTSTSATVTKNWTLPGDYVVTLAVTDDDARTGTYSMIMRVT